MDKKSKQLVRARAQGCCEYCLSREDYSPDAFSMEHVVPRAVGGNSNVANLALACQCCNNHKYNRTHGLDPLTQVLVPLFNPRQDIWQEYFVWLDEYALITGITATGRATTAELHLNRASVVNLRRLLVLADKHPPRLVE